MSPDVDFKAMPASSKATDIPTMALQELHADPHGTQGRSMSAAAGRATIPVGFPGGGR
jgi:hypothetical protein